MTPACFGLFLVHQRSNGRKLRWFYVFVFSDGLRTAFRLLLGAGFNASLLCLSSCRPLQAWVGCLSCLVPPAWAAVFFGSGLLSLVLPVRICGWPSFRLVA